MNQLEAEEEKQRVRQAARERVLVEFEKGQLGLAAGPSTISTKANTDLDKKDEGTSISTFLAITESTFSSRSRYQAQVRIRRDQR